MSRYIGRLVLAASLSLALVPSTASAHMTLKDNYSAHYHAVKQKFGKRAPGRNIRKWGIVRTDGSTRPASNHELARSLRQLKRILRPAPRFLARTATPPAQAPAGVQTAGAHAPAGGVLDRIAQCESGGNPSTNTGNGFYGKYQFDQQTWQSVGGSGLPSNASEGEQDRRAADLLAQRGTAPWPVCGRR